MSFLVELEPLETYPIDALDRLDITAPNFTLGNAQAFMWLSQLAYETDHEDKVDKILARWNLTKRGFRSHGPALGLQSRKACFIAAGGRKATFVTFSGTDPLRIEDWIKDFTLAPEPDVLHKGFSDALDSVWDEVEAAIKNRNVAEQPLFFTGHSMGGAVAILAAERALDKTGVQATAVYTFGSPRTGGQNFFNAYTSKLGDRTFRLVDGDDVVPTVPPILNGDFRHVGQMIRCPNEGQFAGLLPASSDRNDPNIVQSSVDTVFDDIKRLLLRQTLDIVGPRLLGLAANGLPTMVRDHIPTNYFKALGIQLR
jgi:triacylglycerol lipase